MRIPRRDLRFAPLNRSLSGLRHPLPLQGGEGKGEGAVSIASKFRGRGNQEPNCRVTAEGRTAMGEPEIRQESPAGSSPQELNINRRLDLPAVG